MQRTLQEVCTCSTVSESEIGWLCTPLQAAADSAPADAGVYAPNYDPAASIAVDITGVDAAVDTTTTTTHEDQVVEDVNASQPLDVSMDSSLAATLQGQGDVGDSSYVESDASYVESVRPPKSP